MINGKKDFLELSDYTGDELKLILDTAIDLKQKIDDPSFVPLKGKVLGMIFSKSSTRTRVSFESGIYKMGGMGIFLNQNDIQLGRGESVTDTARVLERYIDAIMIRTYNHNDVIDLAKNCSIPVINGLTDYNHPCQVMADFLTILEKKGTIDNIKIAYVGDGNNMANSLAMGASRLGTSISIATPKEYSCDENVIKKFSSEKIIFTDDVVAAVKDADVVYTDVWVSMGQESDAIERKEKLAGYQVNEDLMSYAKDDYIFMHCLPAHRGEEVSSEIIDGDHSVIFDQAENRLHAQNAIMYLLISD